MLSYLTAESYIHAQNNTMFHIKIKDKYMHSFEFQTVPHIISGIDSIRQLGQVLQNFDVKRVLLVTDQGLIQAGIHEPVLEQLNDHQIKISVYQDVQADPSEALILEAVAFAQTEQIDAVIGFGGGSAMDVAKLIAILAHPEQTQCLSDL